MLFLLRLMLTLRQRYVYVYAMITLSFTPPHAADSHALSDDAAGIIYDVYATMRIC